MDTNTLFELTATAPATGSDLDLAPLEARARILIVDDDPDYLELMKIVLRKADFDVSGVLDHRAAVEKTLELHPDAILLDLMMPDVDGFAVYEMLRKVTEAPVIFISAAHRRENLFKTLEMGAEDYISKPFDNTELVARLKKVLREARPADPARLYFFPEIGLRIDLDARQVSLHDRPVRLLPREFRLLSLLAERAPRNVPYETITRTLWDEDSERTRTHMKTITFSLRRKLETDPERPALLVNNRSLGYQLVTQP